MVQDGCEEHERVVISVEGKMKGGLWEGEFYIGKC